MAAKRRGRRAGRKRRSRGPAWQWLGIGLLAGLAIALGMYLAGPSTTDRAPATPERGQREPEGRSLSPDAPSTRPPDADRFEFYDVLPSMEVVVPEEEDPRSARGELRPIDLPGVYVVQAGSFPEFAQADAVKARLALLGIVAEIQQGSVEGRTFHRVRIGPVEDLPRLNRLRNQLRANRIDFVIIRIRE